MKLVAFEHDQQRRRGQLTDDGHIETQNGDGPFPITSVDILPPCTPSKIIGAARNYYDEETARAEKETPEHPLIFFKPPSSLVPPGGTVQIPGSSEIICEAELGVVIDTPCRNVSTEEAFDHVRGYTCLDDVTAIHWGDRENYGVRTKGMDTFCPVGPVLETDVGQSEPELNLTLEVNGDIIADSNTNMMIFGAAELISHISQFMTLEPGDLIAAGAPPQNTVLEPDDSVAIDIEDIGQLEHDVA